MSGQGPSRRTDPRRRGATGQGRDAGASGESPAIEREITLRGMRFHALIGILEHERTVPQPLEVDLTVRSTGNAGILDYRRLYELVERIVNAGPTDYLETVAERVAHSVLEDERIHQARVAVRKPHVALPGPLAYAEIVVRQDRRTNR